MRLRTHGTKIIERFQSTTWAAGRRWGCPWTPRRQRHDTHTGQGPAVVLAAGKAPTCSLRTRPRAAAWHRRCDAALNNAGCGFDLDKALDAHRRWPFESCADPAEVVTRLRRLKRQILATAAATPTHTRPAFMSGGDCCRWSCARRDCAGSKPSEARCRRMGRTPPTTTQPFASSCACTAVRSAHFSAILCRPWHLRSIDRARAAHDRCETPPWSRFDPLHVLPRHASTKSPASTARCNWT